MFAIMSAIMVPIVVTIEVAVMVAAFIPFMTMLHLAVVSFPIAIVEALSIMVRRHPTGAGVGWAGPVTFVPLVTGTHWVPITADPRVIGSRASRLKPKYPWWWRRADSYSDRQLREDSSRG